MDNAFLLTQEVFSMEKYLTRLDAPQVPPYEPAAMAQGLTAQLAQFLFPLLVELDRVLDKRLVRTFLQTIAVILTFRDRANGLLLIPIRVLSDKFEWQVTHEHAAKCYQLERILVSNVAHVLK